MVVLIGNDTTMKRKVARLLPGVELEFLSGERGRFALPADAELVIVFRWSRHVASWAAVDVCGRKRVKFCRGGATQAVRLIREALRMPRPVAALSRG